MHIYYSKNSAGLRTIRHKAAVLWNELPVSLQEINSLSVFKNKLKQYLYTTLFHHKYDMVVEKQAKTSNK